MSDGPSASGRSGDKPDCRRLRICANCGVQIEVGKEKIGRVVWPGGICYRCWIRSGQKKPAKGQAKPQ